MAPAAPAPPADDPPAPGDDSAAATWVSAAIARLVAGDAVGAEAMSLKAMALDPGYGEAAHRLGLARLGQRDPRHAVIWLRRALSVTPGRAQVASNLGACLNGLGRHAEAVAVLEPVAAETPLYRSARLNLAAAHRGAGRLDMAADTAVALAEDLTKAGAIAEAIAALEEAVRDEPRSNRALKRLGTLQRINGARDEAVGSLTRAVAMAPGDLGARLALTMARLPIVYDDEADLAASAEAYRRDLEDLARRVEAATPGERAGAAFELGENKPFYLGYQGRDVRAEQALHGRIAAAVMAAHLPELTPPKRPAATRDRRLKIGWVSAYFHAHSVSKLFRGWVERLDPARFDLHGYDLSAGADETAEALARHLPRMRRGPATARAFARQIRADDLDVLIYPEIGMAPDALRLGALRLAPVQCVAWGHPVTTGLPHMDYFLSSALMEPAEGPRHYTERLVELPNLSIHYARPPEPPAPVLTRGDFGLAGDDVVYLCCQSLYKYLPDHDAVLARIALAVPRARFVFIAHGVPAVTARFRRRIEGAFSALGLSDRLRVVAPVAADRFPDLLRAADVYLDSIGWSGGNTTLEAVAVGLPVVTLATAFMRGRHSAAILTRMGLRALIATSRSDYVEVAARLGLDPEARAQARAMTLEARGALYDDPRPIEALSAFLVAAVDRAAMAPEA